MDSFSSHSSVGSGSPQISAEDFKDQLKNQLAQAYAQEFLEMENPQIQNASSTGTTPTSTNSPTSKTNAESTTAGSTTDTKGDHVLDQFRSSLSPAMVQALICC
ncbi:hypothetical protein Peur_060810 [Populus x canadensis]